LTLDLFLRYPTHLPTLCCRAKRLFFSLFLCCEIFFFSVFSPLASCVSFLLKRHPSSEDVGFSPGPSFPFLLVVVTPFFSLFLKGGLPLCISSLSPFRPAVLPVPLLFSRPPRQSAFEGEISFNPVFQPPCQTRPTIRDACSGRVLPSPHYNPDCKEADRTRWSREARAFHS